MLYAMLDKSVKALLARLERKWVEPKIWDLFIRAISNYGIWLEMTGLTYFSTSGPFNCLIKKVFWWKKLHMPTFFLFTYLLKKKVGAFFVYLIWKFCNMMDSFLASEVFHCNQNYFHLWLRKCTENIFCLFYLCMRKPLSSISLSLILHFMLFIIFKICLAFSILYMRM